jgi:hypothetical protein
VIRRFPSLLLFPLLLASLLAAQTAQTAPSVACHQVVLTGELSAGESFEKAFGGGLVFHLDPDKLGSQGELDGWSISLRPVGAADQDYIYPVSPPLRFNGVQTLGPSYGDNVKASLDHAHEMRFLLSAADYQKIWVFLTNALWPYNAPHPDQAGAEYADALSHLTTGFLKLTVTHYDADANTGSIRRLSFRAELTAPEKFIFDPVLQSRPARCPASAE